MAMVIKNNLSAQNSLKNLNKNSRALSKSLKKISSGRRITGAMDDSSGFVIAERMVVQLRGLEQSTRNAQNGASLLKTADGAIGSTVDILKCMKERAINAANDSNTDEDRAIMQKEFDQYIDQIDDNALVTFNGQYLTTGTHNSQTRHMFNTLANNNLGDNSLSSTSTTPLTDWVTKSGENLGILSSDRITLSVTWQGTTYAGTYDVGSSSMGDIMTQWYTEMRAKGLDTGWSWRFNYDTYGLDGQWQPVAPPDGKRTDTVSAYLDASNPDAVPAGEEGLRYQLGGFTISVADSTGNIKSNVNRFLDDYREVIRAQNESKDNAFVFHLGTKANQAIKIGLTDMRAYALALKGEDGTNLSICTQVSANAAINVLDNALTKALDEQVKIGATLERLDHTINTLVVASENVQNAESTIRDADMAKEMLDFTKNNVLVQASQSMLAQANQNSSNVLSLLQ